MVEYSGAMLMLDEDAFLESITNRSLYVARSHFNSRQLLHRSSRRDPPLQDGCRRHCNIQLVIKTRVS